MNVFKRIRSRMKTISLPELMTVLGLIGVAVFLFVTFTKHENTRRNFDAICTASGGETVDAGNHTFACICICPTRKE